MAPPGGQLLRRVNIAGGVVRVPPVFRGVPKNSLPQLFRACTHCQSFNARLGDPFAVRAFASAGREDVRMFCLKEFDEPYGANVKARLAHLEPHLSTRLGTALRHIGAEIAAVRSHRKLILVLTDGEPSDVDVVDPRDLVEDARRAVLNLRSRGIDVFGVTLDPSGAGSGAAVFGRGQHMPVRRLEDLPARLAELYFRLARR